MTTEIKTRPSNREEQDHYLFMLASVSDWIEAKESKGMEARFRGIPNGWRDLCLVVAVAKNLTKKLKYTYEPNKRMQMQRTADRARHKLIIGPQATTDEEQYVLCSSDFGVLMVAATEKCGMCLGTPADCRQCDLGKTLDAVSFISRQNRAWWEVFERSKRVDIGEEPGYEG